MQKKELGKLEVIAYNITGTKEEKEYNFNTLEVTIEEHKFNLYTSKEDKKLFEYLLKRYLRN